MKKHAILLVFIIGVFGVVGGKAQSVSYTITSLTGDLIVDEATQKNFIVEVKGNSLSSGKAYDIDIILKTTKTENGTTSTFNELLGEGTIYGQGAGYLVTAAPINTSVTSGRFHNTCEGKIIVKITLNNVVYESSTNKTAKVKPAIPTNVTATPTINSVLLAWTKNSSFASGYQIEADGSSSYKTVSGGSTTSYTHTGLTQNTTHKYRIRTSTSCGTYSDWTPIVSATTQNGVPLPSTGLAAVLQSQTEAKLTWNDNSDSEDNYVLERKEEGGSYTVLKTLGANVTEDNDVTLVANKIYYYRVKAVNTKGNSPYSNEVSVSTSVPVVPTDFTAGLAQVSGNSVAKLKWETTGANVEIYRSTGSNNNYQLLTTVDNSKSFYDDATVLVNNVYYYKIKAVNIIGSSDFSNEDSVEIFDLSIPPNVTLANKADMGAERAFGVAFSIGYKGYVGTGRKGDQLKDLWEYDYKSNTWSQKADLPGSARDLAVGFAIAGKGYIGLGSLSNYLKDFWEYNPENNQWARKNDFPGSPRYAAVAFTIDNNAYVGLGRDGSGMTKDFWKYTPATDSWVRVADFGGKARAAATAFSIGQTGYVAGGAIFTDAWAYNSNTNAWTKVADLPRARFYSTGFSYQNAGYIALGADNGYLHKDILEYNPGLDVWKSISFGGTPRDGLTSFVIGNQAFFGTGRSGSKDNYTYHKDWHELKIDCPNFIVHANTNKGTTLLQATNFIQTQSNASETTTVEIDTKDITFKAGNYIVLKPNTHIVPKAGSNKSFTARIENGCTPQGFNAPATYTLQYFKCPDAVPNNTVGATLFSCIVTSGIGPFNYHWYKYEGVLPNVTETTIGGNTNILQFTGRYSTNSNFPTHVKVTDTYTGLSTTLSVTQGATVLNCPGDEGGNPDDEQKRTSSFETLANNFQSIAPNPANGQTSLEYSIAKKGIVVIYITNLMGQRVQTVMINSKHAQGSFKKQIDVSKLTTGTYLCTLETTGYKATKRLVVVR